MSSGDWFWAAPEQQSPWPPRWPPSSTKPHYTREQLNTDETPIILNSVIWQPGKELLLLRLHCLGRFLFMFIFQSELLHLSPEQSRGTGFSGP